jgi:hypothetical protein
MDEFFDCLMTINDDCRKIARQIRTETLSETMPEIVPNIVPEIHFRNNNVQ